MNLKPAVILAALFLAACPSVPINTTKTDSTTTNLDQGGDADADTDADSDTDTDTDTDTPTPDTSDTGHTITGGSAG